MALGRYAKLEIETVEGNEGVAGTVVGIPWYLPAEEVGFQANPALLDRSNEIRGIDGRVVGAPNELGPNGRVACRAYARYLGALLHLLLGEVTTTDGDGVIEDPDGETIPAGAYRHVFSKKGGAAPTTARLTYAYYDKWIRARGVAMQSMAFSIAEDGVRAECEIFANFLSRLTVDPADVVSQEAFSVLPFRRRNVTVEHTGLVVTARTESIDFSIEQSLEPVRSMGVASGWPQAHERANSPEGFARLQGSLTRRDFDPADWDALIAASVFGLKFHFESEQDIGVTGYPYSMWVETGKAQFTGGGPENLKNQARHEASYDWQAGSDAAGVEDFTITVVNDVESYTTP